MNIIKNRKSVLINNAEIEYPLRNGLVVSVIDLHNDDYLQILKNMGIVPPKDKDFSVELIQKKDNARYILELAQAMTFAELIKFCNKKEKIKVRK